MPKLTIEDAFGLTVKTKRNVLGKKVMLPPPPNVLRVLGNIGWLRDHELPGYSIKTQKRRSKRRRLRARGRVQQRQVWRAFGEAHKAKTVVIS